MMRILRLAGALLVGAFLAIAPMAAAIGQGAPVVPVDTLAALTSFTPAQAVMADRRGAQAINFYVAQAGPATDPPAATPADPAQEAIGVVVKALVKALGELPVWLQSILAILMSTVPIAKLVTVFTNTVPRNPFFRIVMRILNLVALNVGKDKNADDKP